MKKLRHFLSQDALTTPARRLRRRTCLAPLLLVVKFFATAEDLRGYLSALRAEGPFQPSLQMSLATGAAAIQLGPRALALAADLNKAKGLSMRKTCAVLRDCFGLQLSPRRPVSGP